MKNIFIFVVSIHLLVLLFFCFQRRENFHVNKKIVVSIEEEKKPKIVYKKKIKTISKKKVSKKLKKTKKNKNISKKNISKKIKILRDIEKLKNFNLDKIELKSKKIKNIPTLEKHEFISVEKRVAKYLKNRLHMPEYGEVKMKLFISKFGRVEDVEIISSKSEKNKKYLKENLLNISFPWIIKKMNFVVSFINDV
jgi:hypothetical protein